MVYFGLIDEKICRILACDYFLYLTIATLEFCLTPLWPPSLSLPSFPHIQWQIPRHGGSRHQLCDSKDKHHQDSLTSIPQLRDSRKFRIVRYVIIIKFWRSEIAWLKTIYWSKHFKTEGAKLVFILEFLIQNVPKLYRMIFLEKLQIHLY